MSFICEIGNRSCGPVFTLTPAIRKGFTQFIFAVARISDARVGFLPAR